MKKLKCIYPTEISMMTALDFSSPCLQSSMMVHNLVTVTHKVVKVLSVMTGVASVSASLTLSEDDVIDVLLEPMDSALPAADLVIVMPAVLATISVMKPVDNVPAAPGYLGADVTNANQVTSVSLNVLNVIATVMLMYVIKIPVSVSVAPETLLETIVKCARKVSMATLFWAATTSASHVCALTDQEAIDNLPMDVEKMTSTTELFVTV